MAVVNGWLANYVVQAIIGVGLILVIAYQVVVGRDIPQELWSFIGIIVGYYFGAAVGERAEKVRSMQRTGQGGIRKRADGVWYEDTKPE